MKTLLTLLSAFALLTATGCGTSDDTSTSPDGPDQTAPSDADPFGDIEWQLTSAAVDDRELELLDTHPVTVAAKPDGTIGGTAACNQYGGSYTVDATADGPLAITLGPMAMTEMACMPDEVNQLESAYLSAMARVSSVANDSDALILAGTGVELRFAARVPEPDAALTGTTWELDSLISGASVSSVVSSPDPSAGSEPTLTIGDDGAVSGSTGCNSFSGTVVIEGDRFEPASLASTERACDPALMDQEESVVAVLGGGPTWSIHGQTLTLMLADGSGLGYRAASGG